VIASDHPQYQVGDLVQGHVPWRTVNQHDGKGLRKLPADSELSPSLYVGVLGMPARTAYFGLLDPEVGRFKAGQTVLVSGAAGAVGSVAGQLAKLKGAAKVIGTAGGKEKCKLVKEKYGFDDCLDYKELDTTEKMTAALQSLCPNGKLDLYFDNTGGHVLYAAANCFNKFARVAICGGISQYQQSEAERLIPNIFLKCIYAAVNLRGFLVSDYSARFGEADAELEKLVKSGQLRYDETVFEGWEKVPDALAGLFSGVNTGKAVVKVRSLAKQ